MTEKRFTRSIQCFMPCFFNNGKHMTFKEVVDCMNELAEENEQLKQQLTSILKLTRRIEDYTHDIKVIGDMND